VVYVLQKVMQMKVKCEVCKTEYSLPVAPNGAVRCAVCGNVWRAQRETHRASLMVFFASLCALLAATVFAVAVIVSSRRDDPAKRPLVAEIDRVETVTETDGTAKIRVNGTVMNRSDDIYGLPDLIIVLHDETGTPISRQRFMPSATLLDAGQSVRFSHEVTGDASAVKKVSVELLDVDTGGQK